jgi:hypothetical protein
MKIRITKNNLTAYLKDSISIEEALIIYSYGWDIEVEVM